MSEITAQEWANYVRYCEAKKADGQMCGVKGLKREISGWDVNLCGTHFNKLGRDGCIVMSNGDVIMEEDIEVTNQVAEININNEEETVSDNSFIYHFLTEKVIDGETLMPRLFTNDPKDSERARYIESMQTKRPVESLLALTTGTWHMHMLQKQLADKGKLFRIMVLENTEIQKISPEAVMEMHARSTYSYANDSHTFFIRIEGEEWGLHPLGLIERDVAKLAKRFAEICRLSELVYHSPRMNIHMRELTPEGDAKFFDGMNYISLKFALKMTGEIPNKRRKNNVRRAMKEGDMNRLNLRVNTPLGLIKGDCIIVDGLPFDIVYHSENIKAELCTDGWCMVTATHHNPYHIAVWDTQTWINNRAMLPVHKQRLDVDKSIQNLKDSFAKGVVPDWLLLGEEMHDDSGLPDFERLSEVLNKQYVLWQAYGHDIRAIANAVYMATNGLVLRMKRELRDTPVLHYRKTWTQMTNAFLAGVITKDSLHQMGGIDMSTSSPYIYHDMRYGLVMSGRRFADTYSLHGGWDLDDSVKVILIKVWSSDLAKTKMMLDSKALDPMCPVPTTEAEAVPAALLVRSPNGPGEFSIEALNPDKWVDMPWYGFDAENIPLVNLATAPLPQSELLKNVVVGTIPTSLVYTGEALTPHQSLAMIEAQRFNPGIGSICNCLMNWAMTFGASFPHEMLALLEQMVDTTQQLRDPVSFKAISEEVNSLYAQMVDKVLAEGKPVDGLLAIAHPIPAKFATMMKKNMVEGRFTRFNNYYGYKVAELETTIRDNSLQMRESSDLVRWCRGLRISDTTLTWAKNFFWRYDQEIRLNDRTWRHKSEDKNPFAKMHFEIQRTNANKATIAKAVAELQAFGGDDIHRRTLALWYVILTPGDSGRYGKLDRLILQPGEDMSIMHLLINALLWRNSGNGPELKAGE